MRAVVLLSGCRAPRPDGCRRPTLPRALVLASLVSIPFLFLKRRKEERKEDPISVLPLPLLPGTFPQSFPVALVSSRAEAEAVFRLPHPDEESEVSSRAEAEAVFRLPHPDEESDRANEPAQCSF